jgi:hypothetical protein
VDLLGGADQRIGRTNLGTTATADAQLLGDGRNFWPVILDL